MGPTKPICYDRMSDDPGDLFPAYCAVRLDEPGGTHEGDHISEYHKKVGIEPFEQYRWPNLADQQREQEAA